MNHTQEIRHYMVIMIINSMAILDIYILFRCC